MYISKYSTAAIRKVYQHITGMKTFQKEKKKCTLKFRNIVSLSQT